MYVNVFLGYIRKADPRCHLVSGPLSCCSKQILFACGREPEEPQNAVWYPGQDAQPDSVDALKTTVLLSGRNSRRAKNDLPDLSVKG